MFKTEDSTLCPVLAWSTRVERFIHTIPNFKNDTTVCSYNVNGLVRQISSTYMLFQG